MSETPQKFGRYEVVAELGRGAMGIIYKAVDPVLDRVVAIKTINLSLDQQERAEYEARFYQEAKAAGGLSHPNIVTVFDLGHTGDVAYMAMELLDGRELRELLDSGPLSIPQAVSIAAQLANALAYAHARGVVHRDIKPANIMILRDGQAKIMDFGVARIRMSDVKTQTGMQFGSPKYMSPEQVLGQRADHRSDIFSLGIILHEMLTGKPPFSGSSLEALMYQTVNFVPPTPSRINRDVPELLDLIAAKMLEKDPAERYQSAREIAVDLRECEKHYGVVQDALANGLYEPPADLLPGLPTSAPDTQEARTRHTDQTDLEIGAATLGISRAFDSTQATRKLASQSGMPELDTFSGAADQAAAPDGEPPPAANENAYGTEQQDRVSTADRGQWNRREKLFVSGTLIAAVLIAALIALL